MTNINSWSSIDALYADDPDAAITYLLTLFPEADEWIGHVVLRAHTENSLIKPFVALLLEKARWTMMAAYREHECAICGNDRLVQSILCHTHWGDEPFHIQPRRDHARNAAYIFHALVILGFTGWIENAGNGWAFRGAFPDGCAIEKPVDIQLNTDIQELLDLLVAHSASHQA